MSDQNQIPIFVTATLDTGPSIELNPVHIESQSRQTTPDGMPITHVRMVSGIVWQVTETPEELGQKFMDKLQETAVATMEMAMGMMNQFGDQFDK